MNKSLKLAVTKGVLFLALTQAGGVAYANGVEYSIKWDGQDKVYRVFMRPQTVPDNSEDYLYYSSQVTIKVPHADNADELFKAEDITSTNTNLGWENSSVSRSPIESSDHDYLSFVAQMPSRPVNLFDWVAGEEQEVFYFSNSGACLGNVEIMDNDTDPFNDFDPKDPNSSNSAGTNPGNEFSSDVWGTSTDNDYLSRYGDPADCTIIVNTNPTAVDDSKSVLSGNSVTIAVLDNDSDLEGDTLTVASATDGSNGTTEVANNEVTYTPAAGFSGEDSFTYTVNDGNGGESIGTVTVTVTEATDKNNAPVANDDTASLEEGQDVFINVADNDEDVDGDTITVDDASGASNGTLELTGGGVLYKPNTGFSGEDTFGYTISDDEGATDNGTVVVTVTAKSTENVAPSARNDSDSVKSGSSVTINVLSNDVDENGDVLSLASVGEAGYGSTEVVDNQAVYTANADYVGTDSFEYTVADGQGGTDTGSVSLNVFSGQSGNTLPTANADEASVMAGDSVTIDVLTNDSDADNDSLTLNSADDGSYGTVTLDGTSAIYTANSDYTGSDSFNYSVSDGTGTSSGIVNITVTAKEGSTDNEVTAPPITVPMNTGESKTIDVLSLMESADEGLTISEHTQGNFGTVTLNEGILIYTPDNDYAGVDSFQYTLSDGSGATSTNTITVQIAGANGVVPGAGEQVAIPTLSQWAQILLTMLLGIVGFRRFSKNNL